MDRPEKYGGHIMVVVILLVLHFGLAAALVAGIDGLALIPWRRAQGAHWTERARLLWPVRLTNGLLLFVIPAALAAAQLSLAPELPRKYLYPAVVGLAGAVLGMWPMTQAMLPKLRFARWLRDLATIFVIRLLAVGVLIAAGVSMPSVLDWTAIPLTVGVVAILLWMSFGGVLQLLRLVGALVPSPPRLVAVVNAVAARMQFSQPRSWLLRAFGANAFAMPLINTLVVTEEAMEALTDEEVGAVCAHEFAHLNEPRSVILARVLATFATLPGIFLKPAIHAWEAGGVFAIAVGVYICSRLTRMLRQRMEKRADSLATVHEGASPGTYARALERLYEVNQTPAVVAASMVHPSLYDRLLAAGVTPAYPRPAPPRKWVWHRIVALVLLMVSVFIAIDRYTEEQDKQRAARRQRAAERSVR